MVFMAPPQTNFRIVSPNRINQHLLVFCIRFSPAHIVFSRSIFQCLVTVNLLIASFNFYTTHKFSYLCRCIICDMSILAYDVSGPLFVASWQKTPLFSLYIIIIR